ncbi:MAG: hypothetical protein A3G41_05935 [Elusimicrobia bacterium RIFCSPLOWO2_12_FULL_59_9]|nr:MAG: hypothetical protein A3G41_05935 [Elusimicrobia bacterium RIFCSPLOWO2_12_FULL_59_9]
MAKKGRKASDEPDLEEWVRYFKKEKSGVTPLTPAAKARLDLSVDLYRFEKYALDVINKHEYGIAITDGKVYFAERGKAHRCPNYDKKQLARIARQIESQLGAVERKLEAKQILSHEHQELRIAARIAIALPELRRNLQDHAFSAEFAASMCRISAAVPDPDAGIRLVSDHLRIAGKKGGASRKSHDGLQDFINHIVKKLAAVGRVTHDQVWGTLVEQYSSGETDTGIRDCDSVSVDGDTFCWTDGEGEHHEIARLSLKRYVTRAKATL